MLFLSSVTSFLLTRLPFFLSAPLSAILPAPPAHHTAGVLSPHVHEYIEKLISKWHVPGIGLSLVASPKHTGGDWVVGTHGFGIADADEKPVTPESMFGIASNSKFFTMLSVGLLIENGTILPNGHALDWSTKMKDILPEWQLMDTYAEEHLDLQDLLSMRSGLPRHDNSHVPGKSPADGLAHMKYLRPSTEIRQAMQYNNYHYNILPLIVPHLLNRTFTDYVQENIFDPLELTSATYNASVARRTGHLTDGFFHGGRDEARCLETWSGVEKVDPSCVGEMESLGWWTEEDGVDEAGAGGIIMSVEDMGKWIRELLDPQVLPRSLITKAGEGVSLLSSTYRPDLGHNVYGMAQWSYSYRGHQVVGHTGGLAGQNTVLIRLPEHGLAMFVAANDNLFGSPVITTIAYRIIDDLLGLKPIDWEARQFGDLLSKPKAFPPISPDTRPAPPESSIRGTYHHPAYGSLPVDPLHVSPTLETHTIRAHLPALSPKLNVTGPMYLSPFPKAFISHVLFTHFDGPVFNWTAVIVYPKHVAGGRTEGYTLSIEGSGSCVFKADGVGMFGDWWGSGEGVGGREVDEERTEDEAEVWFGKG